jgi:methyl-accepting chemotaxis protein
MLLKTGRIKMTSGGTMSFPHFSRTLFIVVLLLVLTGAVSAVQKSPLDVRTEKLASQCVAEIVDQFNLLLTSGKLTMGQLFDTFYIPIPNTEPQKFHTQYDRMIDGIIRPILDKYLEADEHFIFVVAVDRNGYLPTHNARYSQPLTGEGDHDTRWNRTKRIFSDRTGLAAARNTEPILLQRYSRDTGEEMTDLSIPIIVKKRHWGALRIGYKQ